MSKSTLSIWLAKKFNEPLKELIWPLDIPLSDASKYFAIYDPRNALVTAWEDDDLELTGFDLDTMCSRLLVFARQSHHAKWRAAGFNCEGEITGYWQDGSKAELWSEMNPDRSDAAWQYIAPAFVSPTSNRSIAEICRVVDTEDATAIQALMTTAFPDYKMPDDPAVIKHALATNAVHGRGIFSTDGSLLAYASAEFQAAGGSVEITDCATTPAARGQGLMAQIIEALVADLSEVFEINHCHAFAREDQPAMQKIFKKLGWKERGRLVNHFKVDDTWLSACIWGK
ncbi:MAG: GNAT superfamily N-acetyltransferase [Candidatus Krumholzibacteriia bacterium]|jgi:GNAT superfamily N-acetyltransferase